MPLFLAVVVVSLLFPAPASAQPRPPMCVIDMGSNTFRRIVGGFDNGRYVQLGIEKRTVGVGDEVAKQGRIGEAKLDEIQHVLAVFKAACEKDGAPKVAAVGTAAFRDASNGAQVKAAAEQIGIAMEIATERRESELAYLVGSLGRDKYAVIDNGSRSIELVAKDGGAPQWLVFTLGYRVAFDKFFATADTAAAAFEAMRAALRPQVEAAPFMKGKSRLVGVEFAEMVDVLFEGSDVEGRAFTLAELKERLQRIEALPRTEFRALLKTKDIDRALPRLVAAAFLTEAFGYTQLEVTERELGTGLIIEAGLAKR